MKIIILAAGQGTRLRPLTDNQPKCMVEANGKSLIKRQLETMQALGIKEEDIYILTGYKSEVLVDAFCDTNIHFIQNKDFAVTNMVATLMCAEELMKKEEDIIVSYGDIIYTPEVLKTLLDAPGDLSVVADNGWFAYWTARCENPLEDAETFVMDNQGYLLEIGQKTEDIHKIQSQYIGLMRFRDEGLRAVLDLCREAKQRSQRGEALWNTTRNYEKMYMTDLLQGLIEEGKKLKAVKIERGWYEVDCLEDLKLLEEELQ